MVKYVRKIRCDYYDENCKNLGRWVICYVDYEWIMCEKHKKQWFETHHKDRKEIRNND